MLGTIKTPVVPAPNRTVAPTDAREPPALQPGTLVTHTKSFEILRSLGEGGMGRVYQAYDASMDRYVALKVLKQEIPETERLRFHHEAMVTARFGHENLVRVFEVGQAGERQWMVMEYLHGRDLAGLMTDCAAIERERLDDIAQQTLHALRYVHRRGIVHCDVKPENIFVSHDPHDPDLTIVKLIDFGIAFELGTPHTSGKYLIGDPRYMAPERTVPGASIDPRADLYALGITYFEALTGQHPFPVTRSTDAHSLLRMQRECDLPSVASCAAARIPPARSRAIDEFLARACAKRVDDRFANANEMGRALAELRKSGDLADISTPTILAA